MQFLYLEDESQHTFLRFSFPTLLSVCMTQSGIQACDWTSALMASHNLWQHLLSSVAAPGCAGMALSGNSPTSNHRNQPREGLIAHCSHLSLHLIPGLKEKSPTRAQGPEPPAGSEICSWVSERNPMLSKAQNLIFFTYLIKREVPAIVIPQMTTVQQWCWNLYKSLTVIFNQYKLKIAEQGDLKEC